MWFSSFNTNKRSKRQVRGITLANVLRNSVKSRLNMDPKQYSEFQDPSSSNSLHIVLTRLFIVIIAKSKKGHNSINVLQNSFDTRSGNILSFLLPLFQEGQLSVTGESKSTKYWLTA